MNPLAYFRAEVRERLYLALIFTGLLVAEIHSAGHRLLWFDELGTLFTATAHQILHASPTDGNPPFYFFLARFCLGLPLSTEIALRLPSILGFNIAAAAVYWFVRQRASMSFALLALSIFVASRAGYYGVEARPYSVLLCFTALLLCCWQAVRIPRFRKAALAGIFLCSVGAVVDHQYGIIYCFLPIFSGEAVRLILRRKLDLPVLAAVSASAFALLLTVPPTLQAQKNLLTAVRTDSSFWARPDLSGLAAYQLTMPIFIAALAAVAVILWFLPFAAFGRQRCVEQVDSPLVIEELAAVASLALLVPIMLLVTHFASGFYAPRYAVGSTLGVAILLALLASRVRFQRRFVYHAASLATTYCLLLAFIGLWLLTGLGRDYVVPPDSLLTVESSTEPIVIASALEYTPEWFYASSALRSRMHYLSDLSFAASQRDPVPEYSLAAEKAYTPMQMDDYQQFIATHPKFLIYSTGVSRLEWMKFRLLRDGWQFRLVNSAGKRHLYEVTAPFFADRTSAAVPATGI